MSASFWDRTEDGEWVCPSCDTVVETGEGGCDPNHAPGWDFCPNCGQEMERGHVHGLHSVMSALGIEPEPGNLTIMPNVRTWLTPGCGSITMERQARKVAEEALELHAASCCFDRNCIEDEWADCLMALANYATLLHIDMDAAVRRCEKRQQERGRYECQ